MSDVSATAKLTELLGFDSSKSNQLTKELFAEVVGEIQKDKMAEAKKQAKELFLKAMELQKTIAKVKKDLNSQLQKNEKELGKVLNMIQALVSGKEPEEEEQEKPTEEPKELVPKS